VQQYKTKTARDKRAGKGCEMRSDTEDEQVISENTPSAYS